MITCFVSSLESGSILLTGRIRDDEDCNSGHFRQRLCAGDVFYGIGFDEWLTLSSVEVADDGTVIKRLRKELIPLNPEAVRPPFLRDAP